MTGTTSADESAVNENAEQLDDTQLEETGAAEAGADAAADDAQPEQPDADEGEVSIESLTEQLQAAQAKADENWDVALRAKAETDNIKRRAARDVENAHKYAVEKFANELLAVRDSLEMGIKAACVDGEVDVEKLKEGSELTLKQITDVFAKHGIEEVDPVGEKFDPELHQAVSMAPSPDHQPNTVLEVFQKGYTLNGRLMRAAMVVVVQG